MAGLVQRRWAADIRAQQSLELGGERVVGHGLEKAALQLLQGGHDRLGHVLAAVRAVASANERKDAIEGGGHGYGLPPEMLGSAPGLCRRRVVASESEKTRRHC